jgi:hypothetical protein
MCVNISNVIGCDRHHAMVVHMCVNISNVIRCDRHHAMVNSVDVCRYKLILTFVLSSRCIC